LSSALLCLIIIFYHHTAEDAKK